MKTYFWSSIGVSKVASKGTTSGIVPSRMTTDNWGLISSQRSSKVWGGACSLCAVSIHVYN